MSVLVGAAQQGTFPLFRYSAADRVHTADEWHDTENEFQSLNFQCACGEAVQGWANSWWPNRSGLVADTGISDVMGPSLSMQMLSGWITGANGRFGFAGIARDSAGNVLASATIRCYRTSDGLPVADPVTSDANGYFLITTPYYPDAHFLTVHKTTPGPWGGASYDNLVGG